MPVLYMLSYLIFVVFLSKGEWTKEKKILFSLKKERNSATGNHMDEPRTIC